MAIIAPVPRCDGGYRLCACTYFSRSSRFLPCPAGTTSSSSTGAPARFTQKVWYLRETVEGVGVTKAGKLVRYSPRRYQ